MCILFWYYAQVKMFKIWVLTGSYLFYSAKIEKIDKKWPNSKYIAYFQAHTNTYAKVNILKEKYDSVLKIPNVIGISIATRADSIDEECLEYLNELNKKTNLTIELGLQTIHDST